MFIMTDSTAALVIICVLEAELVQMEYVNVRPAQLSVAALLVVSLEKFAKMVIALSIPETMEVMTMEVMTMEEGPQSI